MFKPADHKSDDLDIIRVLALGSPYSDDRVAWCVAEQLQNDERFAGIVRKLASPWDMIDCLSFATKVIILDACCSGSPVGTIFRLNERDLEVIHDLSTHGGSISGSLRMARVLGARFKEVIVLAVEIEGPLSCNEVSSVAREAAVRLEAEVLRTLSEWHARD